MKNINKIISFLLWLTIISCSTIKNSTSTLKPIYQTSDLIITQVSKNTFEHTSFLQTKDYGLVPGNGLVVRNNKEVVVFDTPVDDKSAEELIQWVEKTLHCKTYTKRR